MNRVFHIAGLVWFLICLAVLGFGWPAAPLFAAGAIGFVLLLVFGQKRLPLWIFSAAAAVCFCSLSLLPYGSAGRLRAEFAGTAQTVRGVITDQTFSGSSVTSRLRLSADNPAGLENALVLLRSRPGVEESIGDVVEYALRLDPVARTALLGRGVDFQAFAAAPRFLGRAEPPEVRLALLRRSMAGRFTRLLPGEEGALLSAVLLGTGEALPGSLRETYARAGVSHLLAVSGLHLSVLLALLGLFLRGMPRRARLLLEILLALAFVALTGFQPSMLRAAAMLALCRGALLLGRDADGLNSLGFSVIVILLVNPYAAFTVSLQLSYLAVMGISAFADPMARWFGRLLTGDGLMEAHPRLAYLTGAVSMTLSAQILTAPLLCWQFGRVSLVSPLANLITLPFAAGMLLFGMVCAAAGFLPPLGALCRLAASLAGFCAGAVTRMAGWCAAIPGSSFPVQDDGVIFWMAGTTLLFVALWYLRCSRRQAVWAAQWTACALMVGLCAHSLLWGHPLTVSVANYGGTVLLFRGSQAALIGAPESAYETDQILALMKDYNITSLCLYIPAKEKQLDGASSLRLVGAYPPERVVPLDACAGLEAELFGCLRLRKENNAVRLESQGFSMVKSFSMDPAAAHLLVNGRNEIIPVPGLRLSKNTRYYGCTRLFLPAGPLEDTP